MPRRISDAHIFAAVLETIAERGFAGATTRQIAAAAGINEVTLFRRFGSKAKLVQAALGAEVERFDAGGGARYTGELHEDLTRTVARYAELIERGGKLIAVVLAELPQDPELREIVETFQQVVARVAALIERYQREGLLRPEPPLQAVASLLGPLLVVGLVARIGGGLRLPPPDPGGHVDRYLEGRLAPGQPEGRKNAHGRAGGSV